MEPLRDNHVISRRMIRNFCDSHPELKDAEGVLMRWCHRAEKSRWGNFADVKSTFNATDRVGRFLVFDVGGNKFRVIAEIFHGERTVVLIRHVLTHAEYDRGLWND